jgi:hypothetical protein
MSEKKMSEKKKFFIPFCSFSFQKKTVTFFFAKFNVVRAWRAFLGFLARFQENFKIFLQNFAVANVAQSLSYKI